MNRQPYKSEKRRKEIARQKKQEEKRQKRLEKKQLKADGTPETGDTPEGMDAGVGMAPESSTEVNAEGSSLREDQPEDQKEKLPE